MVDSTEKDKVKTFLIDINVKYQFTGTDNDIEKLKNDKEYLKNVCNALLLNKNVDSEKSQTSSDISVTAVNISNAKDTTTPVQEHPVSQALEVLATATELCQTISSETTPQPSITCTFAENRPEPDIVKQSMQVALSSIPSPSAIKPATEQQSTPLNKNIARTKLRPIAIKPQPPTIYGHTSNSSQQFVPIILKPVNHNSFTLVPQTQVVTTVDGLTVKKPMSCNQAISPKASEFISNQKILLGDHHPFRPVKPNELLLDLYESFLNEFAESKHSRGTIWDKIAIKMVEQGYTVNGTQCNNRWRYLLATFNKIATTKGESNSFKYFNRIAEILHKKSTLPVNINKTEGVLGQMVFEVLEKEEEERPPVKKRRKQKDDEKDEMLATLSKKMEQLQEMQNELTTFLSSFKESVAKKV